VTAPVRVGTIEPSKLIYSVQPVYPRLAAIARIEGSVLLEAVITRDGLVDPKRLKVVDGHNMLWPAAVEAVQQWRYKPTVLSGQRVEIIANITVNFSLNR
jgi:protein TonB